MPTRINKSIIGWIVLAAFNCAVIIPWLSSLMPPLHDFDAFYMAAQVYLQNPGHMLYDVDLQMTAEQQLFGVEDPSKFFLPFAHLPYELVLWLPLAALPFRPAFWIWRMECIGLL